MWYSSFWGYFGWYLWWGGWCLVGLENFGGCFVGCDDYLGFFGVEVGCGEMVFVLCFWLCNCGIVVGGGDYYGFGFGVVRY